MNRVAAAELNGTPEQLIGKRMQDLFPESIAYSQLHQVRRVIASGSGVTIESRSLVAGKQRWYRASIQPLRGPSGEISLALINATDITERKEIEIVLEERVAQRTKEIEAIRQRMELAAQSAGIGIFEWNVKTGELIWDDQMLAVYGLKRQQFGGLMQEWMEMIHQEDLPQLRGVIQSALKGQSKISIRFRVVWPDKSIHYLLMNSLTLYDRQEKPERMLGFTLDISAQKAYENEILSRENLYRALFENSNDAIFLMTTDAREWRANQKGAALMGYSTEEMVAMHNDEMIAQGEHEHAMARFEAVLRGESVPLYERVMRRKDGQNINVEINLSPIYDADGKIVLVQSVVRDISSRKKVEEMLRQSGDILRNANAELERANKAKDEFLANMSHELRTPLTSVLASAESLLEETRGPLNEQQMKSVSNIEASGRHLLSLINDILDLSKIEANKMDLMLDVVPVQEVCQSSIIFVREPANKKNIELRLALDDPALMMRVDGRRMKQVLVNLLSNAVKFTPLGGSVSLFVEADRERGEIAFRVEDTGVGISEEDLQRLFTPFEQVDNRLTRQFEGTGLGLALVKRLVELHGGSVSVSSEMGVGSCFVVTLPWQPEGVSLMDWLRAGSESGAATDAPAGSDRSSLHVLVVDDHQATRETICDYLIYQGFPATCASSGEEALSMIRENPPDILLLDIQMPGMDGLQVTRVIRMETRFAKLPIIAVTALTMPGDRERCLQAGVNEYVVKPVNLKDLLSVIDRMVTLKGNDQEHKGMNK